MPHFLSDELVPSGNGHFLPNFQLNGSHNMALDELLLKESSISNKFSLAFRFYTWQGPWLSIGRNQKKIPRNWETLVDQKKINIVRRPSGGEAVLHSGGLTYALIWRAPPKNKRQSYIQASQWLIKGFSDLGLPLHFGKDNASSCSGDCFATATHADLVDENGCKRVGSAQRWHKGNVLQHGEILLDPCKELWEDLFQKKPPEQISINFTLKEIEKVLKSNLFSTWPNLKWQKRTLTKKELIQIEANSINYLFKSFS